MLKRIRTIDAQALFKNTKYISVVRSEIAGQRPAVYVFIVTEVLKQEQLVYTDLLSVNGKPVTTESTALTFADLGCSGQFLVGKNIQVTARDPAKTFAFNRNTEHALLKMREVNTPAFWDTLFEAGMKEINPNYAKLSLWETSQSFGLRDSRSDRLLSASALALWRVS